MTTTRRKKMHVRRRRPMLINMDDEDDEMEIPTTHDTICFLCCSICQNELKCDNCPTVAHFDCARNDSNGHTDIFNSNTNSNSSSSLRIIHNCIHRIPINFKWASGCKRKDGHNFYCKCFLSYFTLKLYDCIAVLTHGGGSDVDEDDDFNPGNTISYAMVYEMQQIEQEPVLLVRYFYPSYHWKLRTAINISTSNRRNGRHYINTYANNSDSEYEFHSRREKNSMQPIGNSKSSTKSQQLVALISEPLNCVRMNQVCWKILVTDSRADMFRQRATLRKVIRTNKKLTKRLRKKYNESDRIRIWQSREYIEQYQDFGCDDINDIYWCNTAFDRKRKIIYDLEDNLTTKWNELRQDEFNDGNSNNDSNSMNNYNVDNVGNGNDIECELKESQLPVCSEIDTILEVRPNCNDGGGVTSDNNHNSDREHESENSAFDVISFLRTDLQMNRIASVEQESQELQEFSVPLVTNVTSIEDEFINQDDGLEQGDDNDSHMSQISIVVPNPDNNLTPLNVTVNDNHANRDNTDKTEENKFVSVSNQRDVEQSQLERDQNPDTVMKKKSGTRCASQGPAKRKWRVLPGLSRFQVRDRSRSRSRARSQQPQSHNHRNYKVNINTIAQRRFFDWLYEIFHCKRLASKYYNLFETKCVNDINYLSSFTMDRLENIFSFQTEACNIMDIERIVNNAECFAKYCKQFDNWVSRDGNPFGCIAPALKAYCILTISDLRKFYTHGLHQTIMMRKFKLSIQLIQKLDQYFQQNL